MVNARKVNAMLNRQKYSHKMNAACHTSAIKNEFSRALGHADGVKGRGSVVYTGHIHILGQIWHNTW